MATIREVAERAGVSIGTVDRIIHKRGRFSKETAERVHRVIAEAGYRANPIARQLSRRALLRVAVLMPHPEQDSNYWSIPLAGLRRAERDLQDFGVSIALFPFDRYDPQSFTRAAEKLRSAEFDAYILTPLSEAPARAFLSRLPQGAPVVFFDTDLPGARRDGFIGQDSAQSGRLASRLLRLFARDRGASLILAPEVNNHHLDSRIAGFCESHDEQPAILRISVESDREISALHAQLDRVLTPEISGIFVADASVHYVAEYLADRATRPALVGYDLVPENRRWLSRGVIDVLLTQRPGEQGYRALNRLFRAHVLSEPVRDHEYTPIDIITQENLSYVPTEEES